ncbi:altered inheritance of mitochondria mitochondrial [Fusarium heterosporum]|uniref:Altered inheritance of mitochondria mitochondrial n=1 Tax=Fusarium heterosporum TaxID=42747 RepID=A0A8H5T6Q9_FUSHE|nr:altered inheritance of mitochondria mitochondrial [Fusarium heterosporum]
MPGLLVPSPPIQAGWVTEPTIASVEATLQQHFPGRQITVDFFSQGAYNKLFQVKIENSPPQLIRVSLPVDPMYKTLSEVATLKAVDSITSKYGTIPVPKVSLFDFERKSPLHYEWILMNRLDGMTLHNAWPLLNIVQKAAGVRQIAFFMASLFQTRFRHIGNLYPATCFPLESPVPISGTVGPGRIVSVPFFKGTRAQSPERGPFKNSTCWIHTRLDLQLQDASDIISNYHRQHGQGAITWLEQENALRTMTLISDLRLLIEAIIPDNPEETVLHHEDMHANNILADEAGKITGIVDWECVSALPLWKACSFPKFLYDPPRHDGVSLDASKVRANDRHLRDEFLHQMEILSPEWIKIYWRTQLIRDLDFAVDNCHNVARHAHISRWIFALRNRGEIPSLFASIYDL